MEDEQTKVQRGARIQKHTGRRSKHIVDRTLLELGLGRIAVANKTHARIIQNRIVVVVVCMVFFLGGSGGGSAHRLVARIVIVQAERGNFLVDADQNQIAKGERRECARAAKGVKLRFAVRGRVGG
jgi:hypothetical protein